MASTDQKYNLQIKRRQSQSQKSIGWGYTHYIKHEFMMCIYHTEK